MCGVGRVRLGYSAGRVRWGGRAVGIGGGSLFLTESGASAVAFDVHFEDGGVVDEAVHGDATMVGMKRAGVRSYVSEPRRGRRRWKGKVDRQRAVYANRRRIRGAHGRRLMRRRGELVERSFAHVYDTGGMRRLYLRGRENIAKRLLIQAAGFNLGLLMRHDCGIGKPRSLQSAARTRFSASLVLVVASFRPPDRPWAIVRTFGPWSRSSPPILVPCLFVLARPGGACVGPPDALFPQAVNALHRDPDLRYSSAVPARLIG